VRTFARAVADVPYWIRLRRLGRRRSTDYRRYLDVQLRRTLSKRRNDPGVGTRLLVDRVARERAGRRSSVLCIGCRNGVELDEFRARGFGDVTGIDLFSQRHDIEVMDMHELAYSDDSFDVVYCSHSLEHSYDVQTVVGEIARVARAGALVAVEVPVGVRASDADRVEFSDLDELREVFEPLAGEEVWADEQPPRTAANDQGTDVARLVFRLEKVPALVRPARAPAREAVGRVPLRVVMPSAVSVCLAVAWLAKAVAHHDYDLI
jgi:SAM-dependent methyltransferase